jgi:hypothetical protein
MLSKTWYYIETVKILHTQTYPLLPTFGACLGSKIMEWIEGTRIHHYLILNSEGF